jgi:hypothetical protein
MALQHAKLADIQYIAATAGSIYTNPAATKSYIKGLIIFNGNTTSETVLLYAVPNSGGSLGTAGVSNQVAALLIVANDTVFFPFNVDGAPTVLDGTNDSIQAVTTTASKVTCLVIGDKE